MRVNIKFNLFPYKLEKHLAKLLIIPGKYGKLDNNDLLKIKKFLKDKQKNYNIIPSNAIIRSIRSAYMNERELINSQKMKKTKDKIIKEYIKDKDILAISKKFDFSPIKILKYILQYYSFSKNNISLILYLASNKQVNYIQKNFPVPLNQKFILSIKNIIKNDIFNKVNQDEIRDYADAFEKKLEYSIDNVYKLKYKTQEQLTIEQTEKYGRPIITPDFLLLDDLYINNIKINWIDAKNFYGANTRLIKKSMIKQCEKYNKKFGSGAIIFSLGCSDILSKKLNIKNSLFLSFNDFNDIKN
tara:strand:+ start:733 stop:1632 length:900 start_codon:yes stop_codon:yes gene_type:complete